MNFRVNKNSEFPIYQQLKEQIRYFLLNGTMEQGARIPPPKDLGTYLGINKNTVIAAYKELEKEGLLVTRHGQGTYVAERLPLSTDRERRNALMALVKETIEKTRQLGFSAEDLFTLVFNQTVLGLELSNQSEIRALIVECNSADLEYLMDVLRKELEIHVDGCLLQELENKLQEEIVTRADFIVTSVLHLDDVKSILEPLNKEVIAINTAPHLQTFMRIAQLPPGTKVGMVCGTDRGACNMMEALKSAGIENIIIEYCSAYEPEQLKQLLGRVDWVVASRMAYDTLKSVAPPGVRFMEFFNELDEAGVEMLKQYLKTRRKE